MKTLSKFLLGALALGMHASLANAQTTRLNSYDDLVQKVSAAEEKIAAPAAAAAPAVNCCPTVDCCNSCDNNCERGHFYGMWESVVVTPHFTRNDAFNGDPNTTFTQLEWDMKYSPRFELGYLAAGDRLGFRMRYWHFDNDQSLTASSGDVEIIISDDPEIDLQTDGNVDINHELKLRVLDLEAMKRNGGLLFSGGIRYARMDQNFRATDIDNFVSSEHDFEGVGPTVALEGRHRLGNGSLTLFATGRGSVLFGESNWTASDAVDALFRTNDGDVLPIGELQLGVDWSRETRRGGLAFLRVALEGQYWISAGSGMKTDLGTSSNDGGVADPQEPDMGLIGFTIGAGFAR